VVDLFTQSKDVGDEGEHGVTHAWAHACAETGRAPQANLEREFAHASGRRFDNENEAGAAPAAPIDDVK